MHALIDALAARQDAIPETDLIKIAERDVIEAAKAWAVIRSGPYDPHVSGRSHENLAAAVALLESREADLKAIQPCAGEKK